MTVSTILANAGPDISAAFATTGAAFPMILAPPNGIIDAIPAAAFIKVLLLGSFGPSLYSARPPSAKPIAGPTRSFAATTKSNNAVVLRLESIGVSSLKNNFLKVPSLNSARPPSANVIDGAPLSTLENFCISLSASSFNKSISSGVNRSIGFLNSCNDNSFLSSMIPGSEAICMIPSSFDALWYRGFFLKKSNNSFMSFGSLSLNLSNISIALGTVNSLLVISSASATCIIPSLPIA